MRDFFAIKFLTFKSPFNTLIFIYLRYDGENTNELKKKKKYYRRFERNVVNECFEKIFSFLIDLSKLVEYLRKYPKI